MRLGETWEEDRPGPEAVPLQISTFFGKIFPLQGTMVILRLDGCLDGRRPYALKQLLSRVKACAGALRHLSLEMGGMRPDTALDHNSTYHEGLTLEEMQSLTQVVIDLLPGLENLVGLHRVPLDFARPGLVEVLWKSRVRSMTIGCCSSGLVASVGRGPSQIDGVIGALFANRARLLEEQVAWICGCTTESYQLAYLHSCAWRVEQLRRRPYLYRNDNDEFRSEYHPEVTASDPLPPSRRDVTYWAESGMITGYALGMGCSLLKGFAHICAANKKRPRIASICTPNKKPQQGGD